MDWLLRFLSAVIMLTLIAKLAWVLGGPEAAVTLLVVLLAASAATFIHISVSREEPRDG